MQIVKVELNLKAVNKEIALFNCEKKVSGVIHSAKTVKQPSFSMAAMCSVSSIALTVQ